MGELQNLEARLKRLNNNRANLQSKIKLLKNKENSRNARIRALKKGLVNGELVAMPANRNLIQKFNTLSESEKNKLIKSLSLSNESGGLRRYYTTAARNHYYGAFLT